MNFADLVFWGYLVVALVGVLVLRFLLSRILKDRLELYDRISLCLIGLFLLGCVSIQTLVIFATVGAVTFLGLHLLTHFESDAKRRVKWLCFLIPLQLAPLFYYKYAGFVTDGIFGFSNSSWAHLAIPIGISFYTFQLISFAVDTLVYQKPLPPLIDVANFGGFFPQIVAGPIERREKLLPQLANFRFKWNLQAVQDGLLWIILGLFFKRCVADNLAICFSGQEAQNPFTIWLDSVLFGFRIYFDFCGYSLMALGVAACLGVNLTLNFRSPYCAATISDFWRRWHVTLSEWFRDYLYIPLGGARTRKWWLNVLIVFVVSGIWHGAGWNFIFWGGLHGCLLVIQRLCSSLKPPKILCFMLTHLGVFIAWLCFYETDTGILLEKLGRLINPINYNFSALESFLSSQLGPGGFAILMILVIHLLELFSLKKGNEPYRLFRNKLAAVLMILLTVFLAPTSDNNFIYFAF